ncbi:MAG: MASE1 domain-containing protein, partial [Candidatus Binatia bacterium]
MPRTVFLLAFVGGAYFLAGKLGLALAFVHPSATAIWPPAGIAVAAFLLLGNRVWPAVLVGAFLVNSTTAGSIATSAMIAVGNTLEAAVGAALATRFAGGAGCLDRGRDVFRFALLTGLLATTVSPSVGVTSLVGAGFAEPSDYGRVWLTWWLGDVGGVLVVAPFLLLWARDPAIRWGPGRTLEAAGLLATTVALGLLVFRGLPAFAESRYPLSYLCFLPLLWAAFRFGPRESATILFLLSALATWGTIEGVGTFAVESPNHSLALLDAFLTVASLTSLGLAAVVHERKEGATALREAEQRLQELLRREQGRRVEAQATSRAKDQFLAILGHELRSPLSAITHATAAIRRLPPGDPDDERLHGMIEHQTRYMTRLVNDLLEISRLDSGKVGLRREPVDLKDVAERCLASFRLSGRLANHAVSTALASAHVFADPIRLEQIVGNLLENAVQYTPPGGRIELGLTAADGEARLRVVDDGRGIDPGTLPQIFDFFAQADDALDRSHGGLGIGLTIARRLVEMHGGTIEARSEGRNRGSEFRVRLPLEAASAPVG